MPNHVTNEIRITGTRDQIKAFLDRGRFVGLNDEQDFSFRGFVPPPLHPDYITDGCRHRHPFPGMAELIKQQLGPNVDPNNPLLRDSQKPDKHPNCWYVWNRDNWGTKWDCYSIKIGNEKSVLDQLATAGDDRLVEVVQFDTAWSHPAPVFEAIADQFSDCAFEFSWMNEDMYGHGGGYVRFKDGVFGDTVDGINDPNHPETGKLWWSLVKTHRGHSWEQHLERCKEAAEDAQLSSKTATP